MEKDCCKLDLVMNCLCLWVKMVHHIQGTPLISKNAETTLNLVDLEVSRTLSTEKHSKYKKSEE